MITFLKEVFKKGELRRKVVFTLGMLFVFRLGAAITIPYINADAITSSATSSGIFGIMNMLGGGTLERFSLFSLGVSPYITASIIIELLSMDVIPTLAQWQKEGNTGKKKKDKVTRYLTLVLAAIQGGSLTYAFDKGYGILTTSKPWVYVYVVLVMAAGSMFAMWIGDRITIKGVGNGTSLLIFTGIVANLPNQFITTYDTMVSYKTTYTAVTSILWYALFVVAYLIIMIFVVYTEGAVRKIPIFYATNTKTIMHTKENTHMPIKINSSSVIPVIFASSLMMAPSVIAAFVDSNASDAYWLKIFSTSEMYDMGSWSMPWGLLIYIVLTVVFTFFYANLQIDPQQMAENFQKNGSYIPGVKPGIETERYIRRVLNRVTAIGALALVIIASLPSILTLSGVFGGDNSLVLGGTGMIIVVGVCLELNNQIDGLLAGKSFDEVVASGGH